MPLITTQDMPNFLLRMLSDVSEYYDGYEKIWEKIYTKKPATGATEYLQQVQNIGMAQNIPQGMPTPSGFAQQGFNYQVTHQVYGIGFDISHLAIKDNLYKTQWLDGMKMLTRSLREKQQLLSMLPFNLAFSDKALLPDGKPLCSTAHTIFAGGTSSNALAAPIQFSELAVEQMITTARLIKDQTGFLSAASPDALLVPIQTEFQGARLTMSKYRIDTANNDINAIVVLKCLPGGYITDPYLASNNYFLLTNRRKETMRYYERDVAEVDTSTDTRTKSDFTQIRSRFSFFNFGWEGLVGAQAF